MRTLFFLPALMALMITTKATAQDCPSSPVLNRLTQYHTISSGESLGTIANSKQISIQTLIQFNPQLGGGTLPKGTLVVIPPMNGMTIHPQSGATWHDIATSYGLRADVLFELNGCQKNPSIVFIPGIFGEQPTPKISNNYNGFPAYPLPKLAKVGLPYGWQKKMSSHNQVIDFFHSGVALLADFNTPVMAVDDGIVVFAAEEGNYGKLIIINHDQNLQTRYAQLNTIKVKVGNRVKAGQIIGSVGHSGEPDIALPHLSFEVRYKRPVGWVSQDPLLLLIKTSQ